MSAQGTRRANPRPRRRSQRRCSGGVKVTATNDATGVTPRNADQRSGDYGFPEVPVGTYTLTFDLAGFKTNVRKGVTWR